MAPTLPFAPQWTPRHRVAVCGGEQAPPDLPPLEVRTFLEEKHGFLVGYNTGEWGGGLYWYARDGRLLQTILEENVVALTQVEAGWLVITASSSWFGGSAKAQLLRRNGASWRIVRSLPLPGTPTVLLRESADSLLAVLIIKLRPTPGGYEETWLAPDGATRSRPPDVSQAPVSCASSRNTP